MTQGVALPALLARRESLTDLAFDAIREAIVNKVLAPGQLLSERMLAAELQVSKTPVREAMLRLQHMGLIEQTGRGMRITPASEQRMLNAYEVRAALESYTARLAAEHGSDEDCTRVVAVSVMTEQPRGPETRSEPSFPGFYSPDRDFHMLIAAMAGNAHLERMVGEAFTMCWVLRQRDVEQIGFPLEFGDQHIRIADAIQNRDADRAAREMLDHILFVRERFVSHYHSP